MACPQTASFPVSLNICASSAIDSRVWKDRGDEDSA